jgi:crotonobetainyl-CoA:carnitine CoA-transferase CaiB-like acyl-CoA transferase
VSRCDILIESFRPGTLAAWGLPVDQLMAWNPRLVVTSVTDFGQSGPYAAFVASDLVLQAMSGIMQISGSVDREPLKHGLSQSYFCGGFNAAYACLAAYLAASRDGVGEHVDLSLHECLASELVFNQSFYAFLGAVQGRRAVVQDPFDGEPLPTRSGYLSVQAGGGAPFESFAALFGQPELRDPEYATPAQRVAHAPHLRELLRKRLAETDAKQLFLEGSRQRLLLGMVQSPAELLRCEHLHARGLFRDIEHPATGRFAHPTEIVKLSGTPMRVRRRSPMLGEHTGQILAELQEAGAASPARPSFEESRLGVPDEA